MNKKFEYDIIFYDNVYTTRFGQHLANLKGLIPDEHIDLYKPGIASRSCVYGKDKWVGLPVSFDFAVLYTNFNYIYKYNKTIPTTWEELIETSKYIRDEEEKLNNTLMTYNGLFNNRESGTCTFYEFIYSFRKEVNDDYPEFPSKEAIEALEMMKRMKEEIGSDLVFKSSDDYTIEKLNNGKFIFLKYWYTPTFTNYNVSAIPGGKDGISGSTIGGYNIGINDNIKYEKKVASAKVLTFITSKEIQKYMVMEKNLYSGIPSLYEDEEVCKVVDCKFFKSIQLTPRPKMADYTSYSEKFRNALHKFLYGNKSAKEVLIEIKDITHIYTISLSLDDSSVGMVFFIICTTISVLMILSLLVLIKDKDKTYFEFLPYDFWILIVFGSVIILNTYLLGYGEKNSIKCNLVTLFISFGFTLNLVPVLYKLIINFPEPNAKTQWVSRNRYLFLLIFITIDIVLFLLTFISPYSVKNKIINDGKNFQICHMDNGFGNFIVILIEVIKIIIAILILGMIFIEWSLENTYYDIRFITLAIYMNIVSEVLLIIFFYLKVNNYILIFELHTLFYILFSLSNYIFIYGFRLIWKFIKVDNEDDVYIKKFRENNIKISSTSPTFAHTTLTKNTSNHKFNPSVEKLSNRILSYHYMK
ncbi:periplasmic binding protein-like II [Neocallimastix sp. 'constans']